MTYETAPHQVDWDYIRSMRESDDRFEAFVGRVLPITAFGQSDENPDFWDIQTSPHLEEIIWQAVAATRWVDGCLNFSKHHDCSSEFDTCFRVFELDGDGNPKVKK